MQMVDDSYNWHRWWSMRWIMLTAALETARQVWPTLPSQWQAALPAWVPAALGSAALLTTALAAASRVVKQTNLEPKA